MEEQKRNDYYDKQEEIATNTDDDIDYTKRSILEKDRQMRELVTEFGDTIIKALNESNNALDIQIRKLDRTLNSIHQSITWRSLTPLKRRYDHFFHKVKIQSKLTVPIIDHSSSCSSDTSSSAVAAALPTAGAETVLQVKPKIKHKKDIVCFPLINWNFRYQRTQHLLSKFASKNKFSVFRGKEEGDK
jgi:hypothetical protein